MMNEDNIQNKFQIKMLPYNNILLLIFFVAIGALLSITIKGESWDFANYHYYLGYAYANGVTDKYLAPAGPNGFLNPLLDILLYYKIKYFNDYPNIIYALKGIWYGLSLFILFKIITLFTDAKSFKKILFIFLCLALATTRQPIWTQISISTHESTMLFFDLLGLYILLKTIKTQQTNNFKNFIFAGLIMGIALGLKETSAHVCISAGIMLFCIKKSHNIPFKSIFLFALSGFIGYISVNGYFMYKLWHLYQNPFFPFLNNIFRSEYAPPLPFKDTRLDFKFYYPFFPYILYFKENPLCSFGLKDGFFALGYTILIIYWILKSRKHPLIQNQKLLNALAIFLTLDWFIGLYMFGILRYFVVYFALISFFVPYLLFKFYDNHKSIFRFVCFILPFILLAYSPSNYPLNDLAYRLNSERYVDFEKINIPDNALVEFYEIGTSFLIPVLAQNSAFISVSHHPLCYDVKNCGIFGKGSDFIEKYKFRQIRENIIKNHKGPIIYFYKSNNFSISPYYDYFKEKKLIERAYNLHFIDEEQYNKSIKEPEIKRLTHDKKLQKRLKNNYFCREIRSNFGDGDKIQICVPNELKTQILKDNE